MDEGDCWNAVATIDVGSSTRSTDGMLEIMVLIDSVVKGDEVMKSFFV
jgi:hypothetical protein